MRRFWLAWAVLVCSGSARAGTTGELTLANTFVPGLQAPAADVETLTGTTSEGAVSNPTLRVGLSGLLAIDLPEDSALTLRWGLFRDQALCDTCSGGDGPGSLGSELLGSTDLGVAVAHREPLGEDAELVLRVDAVLPASRDALVCNPFYGAPGLGATFDLPVGGSRVAAGVSARRPFYRYDAAPIGRCSPPLRGDGTVDTLTGAAAPTPWNGAWFGASNPSLTGGATVVWSDLHHLVKGAPEQLGTALSTGLQIQRNPVDPGQSVHTLTGDVALAASNRPVRTVIPWAIEAGWTFSERVSVSLGLSNRLPTLLADPGGTFRALPASTALTAAATGHF